jgi:trypsin
MLVAACGGGSADSGSASPPLVAPGLTPQPRIVGGSQAAKGKWPFAAYLEAAYTGRKGLCGGSLIGARWVLTAAHCLRDTEAGDASEARIWLGEEKRPFLGSPYVASRAEGDLWIHPDYDAPAHKNDVALIRLDRPAPQRAVSLVLADDDDMWRPGTPATIVGWGRTREDGGGSGELLEARIPVVSDESCAGAYAGRFDAGTMVCAGGGTVDTCQGDSGGPILVRHGIHWFQFGVVSWGKGCARPGVPGIYSRLETLGSSIVSRLESDSEAAVTVASAETGPATPARDSASVQGTVQPGGLATLIYFQIRPADATDYTQSTTAYVGSGSEPSTWRQVFRGLQPGTEYVYRVSAWSASGGFKPADEKTFTTLT